MIGLHNGHGLFVLLEAGTDALWINYIKINLYRVLDDVHSQPHQSNTRYIFYTITLRNFVIPTRSVW